MKLTRREFLILSSTSIAGAVLSACGIKTPGPAQTVENPNEAQLLAEKKLSTIYDNVQLSIKIENSYGIKEMPMDSPNTSVLSYTDANGVLAPVLVASQPLINALPSFLQVNSLGLNAFIETNLLEFFHWINHSPQAGLEVTEMFKYLQFIKSGIIEPCLNSAPGTSILSRAPQILNGVNLQGVYIFVNRVAGLDNQWVAVVNQETGALVTAYNSSLKGNDVASAKEALKTIAREIGRGANLTTPSLINQNVKQIWQSSDPKTFTYVMLESLKYALSAKMAELGIQLKDVGTSLAGVMSKIPKNFTLLAIPTMVFCETPNLSDTLCPSRSNKIID
ncbi:MAG TPA: hypothetical protein PK370_03505 [Candidatus Woesebacteria bacterium]|nr:hypothetical protein [Candidatus Woesebacteria bacterium]